MKLIVCVNKEILKIRFAGHLWGETTYDRWDSPHKGSNTESM